MRPSYTCTVQPTEEPVTVPHVQAHCRADNDAELMLVDSYRSVAREYVEKHTGRAAMLSTWKRTSSRFVELSDDCHGRVGYINLTPLASVVSIKYYDESDVQQTLDTAVYGVVTGASPGFYYLKSNQSWPTLYDRPDAVEITFTAGASVVSAVPHTFRHAITLLAAHFYTERQPVNVGNITSELPFNLQALIDVNRVEGWIA
jgi:uncharacterized phiE125 gp8 family phage protein